MNSQVMAMVTLTLLMGSALVALPDMATAQDTTSLKGTVCTRDWEEGPQPLSSERKEGCYGQGLPGATVRLQRTDTLVPVGAYDESETTNERGGFAFTNVPHGTYTITISRTGFSDHTGELTLEGASSYEASLDGLEQQIKGRIIDEDGLGIAGATVAFSGPRYESLETQQDGAFQVSLKSGYYHISAQARGHHQDSDYRLLDGTETVSLTLESLPPQTSTIFGRVSDQNGRPVEGVRVNVHQGGYCCYAYEDDYADDDVVREEAPPEPASGEGSSGSDPDRAQSTYPEPYPYYGSNWTTTDQQGRYSINVFAGHANLNLEKEGYLGAWTDVEIDEDERIEKDFTMEKLPDKTARIVGRVTDAAGNGINYVSVSVQSPKWGIHECSGEWEGCIITVNADGTFEARVTPGYSIVRINHDQWRACAETGDADGSFRRDCGPEYFSWTKTLTLNANGTTRIDAKLTQRPGPDAVISGYVVNGESNTGVPNARITFGHQLGHGYGWATTDQDGSFKVRVHSGMHYVSVYADGFFQWEGVVEVKPNSEKPFDVILTAGESRYGGCCYGIAYAEEASDSDMARPVAAGAPAASPDRASGGVASSPTPAMEMTEGGEASSFEDLGGGLGPYDPNARQNLEPEDQGAPGLGLLAALAAVGAALILARRRSS